MPNTTLSVVYFGCRTPSTPSITCKKQLHMLPPLGPMLVDRQKFHSNLVRVYTILDIELEKQAVPPNASFLA